MQTEERAPELAVVICTNRGTERLRNALQALERQSARQRLEVIVVDDGAPEPLGPLCREFRARLRAHPANLGLAAARNTGWRAASAPIVAFTDDDCRPGRDWAEVLIRAYDDASVVAAGGGISACGTGGLLARYYGLRPPIAPLEAELAGSASLPRRLQLYLMANARGRAKTGRREVLSLAGASMSVRRSALELVGGFDSGIRFGGEDEDFFYRLRREVPRAKLIFDPAADTEHDFTGGTADMLRRARSYGRGNARNFVKHPAWGPTVFPVPVACFALVAAGAHRSRWLVAGAVLPAVAFPSWTVEALKRKNASVALLAWLQLLEEAASNAGFAGGYVRARRELRAAP